MEDDMVKARDQLINILYSLEQIYPLAFFNLMIHLVMHLPKEAIEGGHVPFRWMYPFKRYMKKLKNYVRNKAKLEGSIVEGYVADEALNFCSHYILGVETKFNRPDCNQDYPHPTSQFQEFPDNDTKQEFPRWFESKIRKLYIDNDPSYTAELFALVCGPSLTPVSLNSYVVNDVRFVVHNRDQRRTVQNIRIFSPCKNDEGMYYGQLEEILEFAYTSSKVVLFQVKWFDTSNNGRTTTSHSCYDDNDFIDDEDDIPHDLADSDNEVLTNSDDIADEVTTNVYSSDEEY
ncbi:hypothetical protein Tco_0867665 [Tanacetum coccineum]